MNLGNLGRALEASSGPLSKYFSTLKTPEEIELERRVAEAKLREANATASISEYDLEQKRAQDALKTLSDERLKQLASGLETETPDLAEYQKGGGLQNYKAPEKLPTEMIALAKSVPGTDQSQRMEEENTRREASSGLLPVNGSYLEQTLPITPELARLANRGAHEIPEEEWVARQRGEYLKKNNLPVSSDEALQSAIRSGTADEAIPIAKELRAQEGDLTATQKMDMAQRKLDAQKQAQLRASAERSAKEKSKTELPEEVVESIDEMATMIKNGTLPYPVAAQQIKERGGMNTLKLGELNRKLVSIGVDPALNTQQWTNANNTTKTNMVIAINSMMDRMKDATKAINAYGKQDFKFLNKLAMKYGLQTGDPKSVVADLNQLLLAEEGMKVLAGSGTGGEGMLEQAHKFADPSNDPEATRQAMNTLFDYAMAKRNNLLSSMGPFAKQYDIAHGRPGEEEKVFTFSSIQEANDAVESGKVPKGARVIVGDQEFTNE